MLNTYIKLAWRTLNRFRIPFLISICGLFLATTAFFLITRYVWYHLSIDGFHHEANRIVRINTLIDLPNQSTKYAATAFDVGPDIQSLYPDISHMVRIRAMPTTIDLGEVRFDEGLITYVDSAFFNVFSFNLIEGDRDHILKRSEDIVITREVAEKYFPGQSAVGSVLKIHVAGQEKMVTVQGVVENPPSNSSINFTILANMDQIAHTFRPGYASIIPGLFTYVKLGPETDQSTLKKYLHDFVRNKVPENLQRVMSFQALYLRDIYFEQSFQFDSGRKGNKKTIYSLITLALLALIIAIINYVNISTALSIKRSREIAVRKILGSSPGQIARQQLIETFLLISGTILLSVIVTAIIHSQIDEWLEMDPETGFLPWFRSAGFIVLCTIIISILSGAYPAFVVSRMSVVAVLKKKLKFFNQQYDFKKILLGFQFTISVFFLITAWIVFDQMHYMKEKDPGFNRENIIMVDIAAPQMQNKIPALKETLRQVPGVMAMSASTSGIYGMHTQANFSVLPDSNNQSFLLDINYVDADFLETYQVNLVGGRNFSAVNNSDIQQAMIINEKAVEHLGLVPGKNVIGTSVQKIARDTTLSKIIGVVADYHFQSLHQDIAPMIWQIVPEAPKNTLAIRTQGNVQPILLNLKNKWAEFEAGETFDYAFLDQMMTNAYRTERQLDWFVRIMTIILLFITTTGMYGMMLFIIEQKTTEISIRKTLGANIRQLMFHLHRQYLWIMLFGFVVGGFAAYGIAQSWLENFAYRINPGVVHFLGSGLMCLFIATFAIIFLTYRAASLNPVDVLKND